MSAVEVEDRVGAWNEGGRCRTTPVESLHRKPREQCLKAGSFGNLFETRAKIAAWREEYNETAQQQLEVTRHPGVRAANGGAPVAGGSPRRRSRS
jgi:integrase-like protein